jgi:hypothetical protein
MESGGATAVALICGLCTASTKFEERGYSCARVFRVECEDQTQEGVRVNAAVPSVARQHGFSDISTKITNECLDDGVVAEEYSMMKRAHQITLLVIRESLKYK